MAVHRRRFPSTAALGLTGPHAASDIEWLGWDNEHSLDLLWTLAGAGDPNLALNALHRLGVAMGDDFDELNAALRADATLRVRLLALLGGSTKLGDHLIAHPQIWPQLAQPVPTADEIMTTMLSAVEATPIDGATDLSTAGTYRAAVTGAEAKTAMTTAYRTLIMRIAAADLAGTFAARRGVGAGEPELAFDTVTGLLTTLADAGLTAALAVAVTSVYGDDVPDSELAVIAMGKCGAKELNYISDVDVIFVAEPASAKITRVASEFIRLGTTCFFEVDANLRPEGRSGALVRTVDSHVAYYQRWAETWEFQALLKARPMTGNMDLGQRYKDAVDPMVWEASQRDSFVDDVQRMRVRVVDNVPADLKDRELKLGSGGLRDVEFAVQLLQLVHGRADEDLRVTTTTAALRALADEGYIGRDDGAALVAAYEFLRLLEHRLQQQRLKRTHAMPVPEDQQRTAWLASAAGYVPDQSSTAVEKLHSDLRKVRKTVSGLHRKLFYRPLLNAVANVDADALTQSQDAAVAQLAALGYRHPDRAYQHLSALAAGNSRKAKLQNVLLPALLDFLGTTADPDAGLLNYRKLSEAAFNETWFLRTLRDDGVVAQRLMFILGTSPYASDLIISTPKTVKLLSDGASQPKLLDTAPDQVTRSLVAASKRHEDPDKAVSVARSLRRAELARIASADLLGFMDVPQVCLELSLLWNAVLDAALRAETRASLLYNGWAHPPARIAVIGMGRLGGAELGYGSDADVMIVAEPVDGWDEAEDIDAVAWASTIIENMRGRLSKPSADPALEVDLDLRPEGRSGQIVRTIASYERYYREWGEVWEKQALQRASYIAGDEKVAHQFLRTIDQFRYPDNGASAAEIREIRRMKARIDDERLPRGADRNTHTKLGRGALTDIEWTVQLITALHAHTHEGLHNTSTLDVLDYLEELDEESIITADQVRTLRQAWLMATKARNALALVRGKRVDQLPTQGAHLVQTAGAAGWKPVDAPDFLDTYLRLTRRAHTVVNEVFWGESLGHEFN